MNNRQIAEILFNVATLLDMAQDNIYRVRAYRRAARRVLALCEEAATIVARGEELPLPGVGRRMRCTLAELLLQGSLAFYGELLDDLPDSMRALMALEGVGPKTALRLAQDLELATPRDVIAAAESGQIRRLYGFGPQREANLAAAAHAVVASQSTAA